MINVKSISIRSFDLDHLDIFWEIDALASPSQESKPHEIWDYDFYVLRSEAPMGPWDVISEPLRDTYSFRDMRISLLSRYRRYYYQVRVVHRPSEEKKDFGPSAHDAPPPDLIAAEVIRQEDVYFREFVGRRCILYPVRTFGPACICYDFSIGRKTRANHQPCYGTGWLGGYLQPFEAFVQIDPSPKGPQPSSVGDLGRVDTTARMISFPPVKSKDILIESENRRWRVVTVSGTERLRSVVRQELQLHEITKGDVEYALPVKADPRTFQPSAERNFTNPQNVENDGDYSDILAAYGGPRGSLR